MRNICPAYNFWANSSLDIRQSMLLFAKEYLYYSIRPARRVGSKYLLYIVVNPVRKLYNEGEAKWKYDYIGKCSAETGGSLY